MIQLVQKTTCIILLILVITSAALSQNNSSTLVYVEADPLAYINQGYSIHFGLENLGIRYDLTLVKVDFPSSFEEAFYDTKAFDLKTNIVGIKVDYLGQRNNWTKGAFIGIDINHQTLNFKHYQTSESKDLFTYNLGIRAGYKFNIYKGLYVTPWAAVWRNVNKQQSFSSAEDIITTNKWDWITTFHIGYAYNF